MNLDQFQVAVAEVLAEVHKVIIGQEDAVRSALIVVLCNQHALIEGVPGLGKTLLARTLARAISCDFQRIQFTPDLMPADITGTNVFNMRDNTFALMRGPVFTDFLLADEINRAPSKTQAALLEAMQERSVTIDRDTYQLSSEFTVFATQNPIEFEGTYPLPEAQKDRFLLKITIGWPEREDELNLARRSLGEAAPEAVLDRGEVRACFTKDRISGMRKALEQVRFSSELVDYVVETVRRTRISPDLQSGAGPRATQAVLWASRAFAALAGRDFVTPDDVHAVATQALEHRVVLRPESELEGERASEVIMRILREVPVPR